MEVRVPRMPCRPDHYASIRYIAGTGGGGATYTEQEAREAAVAVVRRESLRGLGVQEADVVERDAKLREHVYNALNMRERGRDIVLARVRRARR